MEGILFVISLSLSFFSERLHFVHHMQIIHFKFVYNIRLRISFYNRSPTSPIQTREMATVYCTNRIVVVALMISICCYLDANRSLVFFYSIPFGDSVLGEPNTIDTCTFRQCNATSATHSTRPNPTPIRRCCARGCRYRRHIESGLGSTGSR